MPIRLDQIDQQDAPGALPATPGSSSSETSPEELSLGQTVRFRTEQARRAAGRFVGTRQRQTTLQNIFDSRAVTIQKNLGDAANISEREQRVVRETFPRDGETDISRQEKMSTGIGLFDTLEQRTQTILSKPVPMVMTGLSKAGPRFAPDPAQQAVKRKAVEDMAKIQQGRILLKQMFDEATEKMPPISTQQQSQSGVRSGQPVRMRDAKGREAFVYPDGRIEPIR